MINDHNIPPITTNSPIIDLPNIADQTSQGNQQCNNSDSTNNNVIQDSIREILTTTFLTEQGNDPESINSISSENPDPQFKELLYSSRHKHSRDKKKNYAT